MKKTLTISSLKDMERLAGIVAECAMSGWVIGLKGDLGSGKTTFTKYLARYLAIQDTVNSPTFTILKVYQGEIPLYHMDVYRLEDIGYDYELDEYIYNEGISVVEWYPYIRQMLPETILSLEILRTSEDARKIIIEGSGDYETIVETIGHRYGDKSYIPQPRHR
jgi:tRNA threonylcarbamoyladenosine biosynthesis protein TsaE